MSEIDTFTSPELDKFPSDWQVRRFDSLFAVQQGKQISKKNRIGENQRPFLRTKNVFWGRLDLTDLDEMHFTEAEEKRLALQPGDLLVCEGGDIGRTAIWRGGLANCYYQNHLHRARAWDGAADSEFALYWLWYAFEIGSVYFGRGNVTTIPNLSQSKLCELPLPNPPLAEQQKIAGVLGLVQQAIEQQKRLIALTTELKKTLLHKLFTEGLHGEPQKQTDIGPIPQSWEVVPLGSLAKIGNGSTPKRDNEGYWQDGTIPWLNSAKIHERFIVEADQFVTDLAVKECHLPRVKPSSLLVAITGQGKTLGNSALVSFETCINQHLAYAQFTSPRVVPEFVLWFMQTRYEHLRSISQAGGSTKGALTCGYLKTYPIPVPSLDEQQDISKVFAVLDQKERVHQRKHVALTALFRTLLYQLMTAQIRVHDLDLPELEGNS
ncbi:MAG: restriction endonuclease subunit S [Nitrospirales bacterium]|nr:restriction endonuclease subunit S [Nitrospirales bacterium]